LLEKFFKNIVAGFHANRRLIFILILAFSILRFFWLNYINWENGTISNGQHGIKIWLDSGRYTYGAEKILLGMDLEGREKQFLGYILFLTFFKLFNIPLEYFVAFQMIIALLASFVIYRLVLQATKSKFGALFSAALFLNNPFIVQWHQYILTESLYTSFLVFCFWKFYKLYKNFSFKNIAISLLFVLITLSVRPNGWILIPIFVWIVIDRYFKKNSLVILSLIFLLFVMMAALIPGLKSQIQITTPVENLQNGVTVWDHPELYINMPQEPDLDIKDWTSGIKYIVKHPLASLKLGLIRVGYSLIHIRPYHSIKYQIRVLFWIIPAYVLFIVGFLFDRKNQIYKIGIMIIVFHLLIIFLTYAEHDSRFDIYILPVFYILSGVGLVETYRKLYYRLFKKYEMKIS